MRSMINQPRVQNVGARQSLEGVGFEVERLAAAAAPKLEVLLDARRRALEVRLLLLVAERSVYPGQSAPHRSHQQLKIVFFLNE